MSKLIFKEFKLCFHPTIPLFYSFIFMLFIPSYLYQVPFFFICNAIFYMFQRCVMNNDILFTALLPVAKKDTVKAMFVYVCILELIMLALYVPMIFVNHAVIGEANKAGLDASFSLIGMGFILFAIFNAVFIPKFYKTGYKAGKCFMFAAIAVFIWIFASEGFFLTASAASDKVYIFNWIASHIDCWPTVAEAISAQLILLAVCAAIYSVISVLALNKAVKNFEMVDL